MQDTRLRTDLPKRMGDLVASQAFDRRIPVHPDYLAVYLLVVLVTLGAGYPRVGAIQRKTSVAVIEPAGFPRARNMTTRAILQPVFGPAELAAVRILVGMAPRALGGTSRKQRGSPGADSVGLPGRLVTPDARQWMIRVLMRPFQRESGTGMIKGAHNLPLVRGVAGLADQVCLWVNSMRIGVTDNTGAGNKVRLATGLVYCALVDQDSGRCSKRGLHQPAGFGNGGCEWLVTLVALDTGVAPGQREL